MTTRTAPPGGSTEPREASRTARPPSRTMPRRMVARAPLRILLVPLLLLAAGSAAAEERVLRLDPSSSRVTWVLGATLHKVEGTFKLEEGLIRFDPATGEASGRVEIPAASGTSGNESRDEKMHETVLESAKYPDITFLPRRLTGSFRPGEGGEVALEGILEIHGASHEITVTGTVQVSGDRLTGTADLTIPYVEWGMEDPSVFVLRVKKSVEIRLELVGSIAPGS